VSDTHVDEANLQDPEQAAGDSPDENLLVREGDIAADYL